MQIRSKKTIAVTAPSGAGKTTVVKHLMAHYSKLAFSVSATTRSKRPLEVDGHDYFFLSEKEFKQKIQDGEFVEWEEVYPDVFYGTLKSEVKRVQSLGKIVVFDIDVKGAVALKKVFQENCMTIFIKPPSIQILRERLKGRRTESPESIEKRLKKAGLELSYEDQFDITLINDILEKTLINSKTIVKAFFNLKIPL